MSEDGRDDAGRFAVGCAGGPGRPKRAIERAYVDATIAAVSIDDWTEIVRQAVGDAKAGDAVARAWLSKQLGTDSPQRLAVTDADGGPLTLATFLSIAAARHDAELPTAPPSNVIDVDAEYARLTAQIDSAESLAIDVADDGTLAVATTDALPD